MTEVLLSERTRPKGAIQLKVEVVKAKTDEGPFRFLIKRALKVLETNQGRSEIE